MAKEAANEIKVSTMSTSDHALLSPSSQYQSPTKQLAVVGKGMCRNNLLLSQVLQADIQRWYPWSGLQQSLVNRKKKPQPEAFIGWGHKKSFQRADKAATRQDLNTLSIEDGFLRSLVSGISSRHGLSVVVDDIGIYFDMMHHSRLEQLIVERTKSTSNDRAVGEARARHLMARICEEKLSKYNSIIDCPSLDKLINKESI
ncbi:capsular polysaccharide export protein, LipB/KpsS family, partial [Marinobacter sp. 1Y8]